MIFPFQSIGETRFRVAFEEIRDVQELVSTRKRLVISGVEAIFDGESRKRSSRGESRHRVFPMALESCRLLTGSSVPVSGGKRPNNLLIHPERHQ
jgi:hypothetical protein